MITPEQLRKLIRYEPGTGLLFWRPRALRAWDVRWALRRCFAKECWDGSLAGKVLSKYYRTHRVAWAIHYGEWPSGQIDHIDGDPTNNRISNLRDVSFPEQMRNKGLHRRNASGAHGVSKVGARWVARIGVDRALIWLGTFEYFQDALAARKAAERRYGFHENHGRARAGCVAAEDRK